jgi:IS30 family transposase
MQGGYTHLTKEERDMIAILRAQGTTLSGIARKLGRHKATILRELNRNSSVHKECYLSHKAQERSEDRWAITHKRERIKNKETRKYVESCLRRGWSPEITAHRLSIERQGESISHEAIYQYVYEERKELIFYLVRRHRKRRKKGYGRKYRQFCIPNRVSIIERPEIVGKRERIGDWENDTMVSSLSKVAINVLTERKSRMTLLRKLPQKTGKETKTAILESLGKYPAEYRHTITYDNGPENIEHEEINKILDTRSYFCEPYHSWEKGTVENTIGLIRRWLPKKTDLSKIGEGTILGIEKWLNNRPRKCLNYQTPLEVLGKELSVALAG